jgi:hypothetical protein
LTQAVDHIICGRLFRGRSEGPSPRNIVQPDPDDHHLCTSLAEDVPIEARQHAFSPTRVGSGWSRAVEQQPIACKRSAYDGEVVDAMSLKAFGQGSGPLRKQRCRIGNRHDRGAGPCSWTLMPDTNGHASSGIAPGSSADPTKLPADDTKLEPWKDVVVSAFVAKGRYRLTARSETDPTVRWTGSLSAGARVGMVTLVLPPKVSARSVSGTIPEPPADSAMCAAPMIGSRHYLRENPR